MKLEIVNKALRYWIASGTPDDRETNEAIDALQECAATVERYEFIDVNNGEVYPVPTLVMSDMLNALTYDTLGKRAKSLGDSLCFGYYEHDCHKIFGCAGLANFILRDSFEYLKDLWHYNEKSGDNTATGTFLACSTPDHFFKQANGCIEDLIKLSCNDVDSYLHSITISIDDKQYHFYDSAALVNGLLTALKDAREQL